MQFDRDAGLEQAQGVDDVRVAVRAELRGGEVDVLSATTVDGTRVPAGVRAGVGAATSPDRSWQEARTALRFTTPRRPVVHAELGAPALPARVPEDAARANADVAAIEWKGVRTSANEWEASEQSARRARPQECPVSRRP